MARIILLFLFPYIVNAQNVKNNYRTTIENAEKVTTKGGIVNIYKAKAVFVTINTDSTIKSKLYFESIEQYFDSSSHRYITNIYFNNPRIIEYTDIYIKVDFNNPVLSVFDLPGPPGGTFNASGVEINFNENSTSVEFKAMKILSRTGIMLTVASMKQINVNIWGVIGAK